VAAIALDSAEWWYLERLMAAGKAPNLARLRARSAEIPLVTEMAYRTELVWGRFLSGREPLEEQDWAASSVFHPHDYTLTKNTVSMATPFYALGSGTKVIALDLIHSHPVDGVDGAQVVGWGSHSPQFPRSSKPAGLLTEIDERFGVNPAFNNEFGYGWYDPPYLEALGQASAVGAERRFDAARWLLEQHPDWDLLVTCVSEFHTIGHQMWHGIDERHPLHGTPWAETAGRCSDQTATELDASIGRLVDALPDDTTVLVFALHGMQVADDVASTLLMPELFHRLHVGKGRGLLADPDQEAWRRDGMPPMVPEAGEEWGDYIADRFADDPKGQLRRAVRRRMSRRTFDGLRRLAGKPMTVPQAAMANTTPPEFTDVTVEDIDRFRRGIDFQVVAWYRRHWPQMPYFALPTFGDGHVRVNLRGRERDGIVERDDYRRACDDAIDVLRQAINPRTGSSIVGDVIRLRDGDPCDPDGPDADLLIVFQDGPDAVDHPDVGTVGPYPHLRSAQHSPNGFVLMSGPGVLPGRREARPTIDLTPTVLSLLGADTAACHGTSFAQLVP
jgi:predicted AlkP superfamily phosphohydrolase/phosphomutase